jgi:RNA polymerase sigma factor (sigma-70 family)
MEAATLRLPGRLQRPGLRRADTDGRLVAEVRSGDSRAFETIFDRYHGPLLSFCRHMLGRRDEAEDALQQTFMSAYRSMVSSDRPIQLRAWLFTIARNHCISILRARRETASLDEVASATDGLAAEVQRREDLRNMLADVGRLPDDQRAALVLAELGALSHQEIAAVLGCRPGKVKALVFQARTSLNASRNARETPCEDVREQLATLAGGALRRSGVRRHLRACSGCRQFGAEVQRQRRAMAVLLPVAPTIGLKHAVLAGVGLQAVGGAAVVGGAAGTGAAAAGAGLLGGSAGATKLIAAGVLAAGAGGVALSGGEVQHASKSRSVPHASGARPATAPSPTHPTKPKTSASKPVSAGKAKQGGHRSSAAHKSGHGRAADSPGRAGTSLGLAGNSPGRAGASPGRAQTSPGRSDDVPGKSGSPPGHLGDSPGQAGTARGRSVETPGRSVERPGQPHRTPGQSGKTPGKDK